MIAITFRNEDWSNAGATALWQLPVLQGFRAWAAAGFPDGGMGTFLAFWQLHRSASLDQWVGVFLPACRRLAANSSSWSTSADAAAAVSAVVPNTQFDVKKLHKDLGGRSTRAPRTALSKAAYALRPDLAVIDDSLVRKALNVRDTHKRLEEVTAAFEELWKGDSGKRACQEAEKVTRSIPAWEVLAEWRSAILFGRRILDCALMEEAKRRIEIERRSRDAAKGLI